MEKWGLDTSEEYEFYGTMQGYVYFKIINDSIKLIIYVKCMYHLIVKNNYGG